MAAKGSKIRGQILGLLLNGTPIPHLADNASSSPDASLYVSLHATDPTGSGQSAGEVSYTGYARVAVARSPGSPFWTIVGEAASPSANILFGSCTGGSATATYVGVGTDPTGAGELLYAGPLEASIPISSGRTPFVSSASTITET